MKSRTLLLTLSLLSSSVSSATTLDATPTMRNNPHIVVPERVKVSPFSGTAGYTYAFEVPPGAGGLAPRLTLAYNTETRNTEYGYGWKLNLGWIERSTRLSAPHYTAPLTTGTDADTFELDGDLLVRDGVTNEFRPRYSNGRRVRYDAAVNTWEVAQADGTRFLYGTTEGSLLARSVPAAYPGTPPTAEETFRWGLSEVVDPRGNSYRIVYAADLDLAEDGTTTYTTYIYPERIDYSFQSGSQVGKLRVIDLVWGSRDNYAGADPDPTACNDSEDCPTWYRGGFKIQQRRRLTDVVVSLDENDDGAIAPDEQIRRYELRYYRKSDVDPLNPPYSQLEAIQRYGRGDVPFPDAANPVATTFTYSRPPRGFSSTATDWGTSEKITDGTVLGNGVECEHFAKCVHADTRDLNGDGLPDRIRADSTTGVWSVAYGRPDGFQLDGAGNLLWNTWLWDCDGDGNVDEDTCPAARSEALTWEATGGTSSDLSFRHHDLLDMNGDGRPDRVVALGGCAITVYPNTGTGFSAGQSWWDPQQGCPPLLGGTVVYYASATSTDTQYIAADVNGDGLPDMLGANTYINHGSGFDGAFGGADHFATPNSVEVGTNWSSTVWNLVDANGDGLVDVIPLFVCLTESSWVNYNLGLVPESAGLSNGSAVIWQGYSYPFYEGCQGLGYPYYSSQEYWQYLGRMYGGAQTLAALLDLNGDGVQDYAVADEGGGFEVYFGLGDGRFLLTGADGPGPLPGGVQWDMSAIPATASDNAEYSSSREHLIHSGWLLDSTLKTMDINGDGLLDYVNGLDQVYLQEGPRTGLLRTVTNELGGATTLDYAPSTHVAAVEEEAFAEADFTTVPPTSLLPSEIVPDPRVRWLVTSVTVSDGRAGTADQSQALQYAGLRFDMQRREGFGARLAESVDATGVATRSLFHQQPALRGKREYVETCDGVACYSSVEALWVDVFEADPNRVPGTFLARPTRTTATLCDSSDPECDTGPFQRREIQRQFDPLYGNLEVETDCGADADCGTDGDNLVRTISYATNAAEWMVSYPLEESVYFGSAGSGTLVSRTRNHYDTGQFAAGANTTPQLCDGATQPCGGLVRYRETLRDTTSNTWAVEQWDYDVYGNMQAYFDPETYAAQPANATQQLTYDGSGAFPLSIRNALLEETALRFDEGLGAVSRALEPSGHLGCWEYDDFGRLEKHKEASQAYDDIDEGFCSLTLATFAFSSMGDAEAQHIVETAEAVRSLRFFDGLGREYESAVESRTNDFDVVTLGWGERGELRCATLPQRRTVADLSQWQPALCDTVVPHRLTSYDPLLRPTVDTLVSGQGSLLEGERTYGINAFDGGDDPGLGDLRVEKRTTHGMPDRVQYIGRNNRGEVVFLRDGTLAAQTTLVSRDAKGRIIRVDGPDVALDATGGDPDPNLIEIVYNAVDQRTQLSQPAGPGAAVPSWAFEYDLNGDLVEQISPRQQGCGNPDCGIRLHYDGVRRLVLKDYAPFTSDAAIPGAGDQVLDYYAAADFGPAPARPGLGLLKSMYTVNGLVTDFTYDLRGRVASRARDYGGSLQFSSAFSYDALGRPTFTFLPDGGWISRTYDAGALDTVQSNFGGGIDAAAEGLKWHASRRLQELTLESPAQAGPPVTTTYGYRSNDQRLGTAETWIQGVAGLIHDLSYDYDEAGNLLEVTDDRNPVKLTQSFTYDTLHRLVKAVGQGTHGYGELGYVYDEAGNLREKGPQVGGQPAVGRVKLRYGRPGPGAPAAAVRVDWHNGNDYLPNLGAYSYDGDGGMVQRRVVSSVYDLPSGRDPDGRMALVELPGSVPSSPLFEHYLYDEFGERAEKTKTGAFASVLEDRLYVDASYEVDAVNDTHTVHLFVAGQRVASSKRSGLGTSGDPGSLQEVQFYHPDHVGSNTVVTKATGDLVQETFFRPFGALQAMVETDPVTGAEQTLGPNASATPYLFTDQERDANTGLQYSGARYYDSWLGRFMSQDPELIGATAGVTFLRIGSDSQQANGYSYVGNRPSVFVDPTGRLQETPRPPAPTPSPPGAYSGSGPMHNVADISAYGVDGYYFNAILRAQQPTPEVLGSQSGYPTQPPPADEWPEGATAWDPIEGFYYGTTEPDIDPLNWIGGWGRLGAQKGVRLGVQAGKPALSAVKRALKEVHKRVGKILKGRPGPQRGKFGSPQRGTPRKGYRLDPPGDKAKPGSPEEGWHFNWWDYSGGKRGSGGDSGAIPIE